MPLTEKQIAELLLRYIARGISPEEKQELLEYYASLSHADRINFDKMIDRKYHYILKDLRDYYEFSKEVDALAELEFGKPRSDDTKPSKSADPEDPGAPTEPPAVD
ncbi:MAG TPA: hypothetical protein VGM41_14835 [Chitinophagaceae bacterium]|jgi:hypothetical protein